MDGKACTKCEEHKPLPEFGPDKRRLDGRKSHCRDCCRKAQNQFRAENVERVREIEKRAMAKFACPGCNLSKNAKMPWEFNGRLL